MNYEESIDFLYNSLPVYQRIGQGAYKPGLQTSLTLARLFGNPERTFTTIHIAGTNGKGSTAHSLAAILQSNGYRTGLYTSPHIFDFRERIRVNGEKIPREVVCRFVERWMEIRDANPDLSPSFFELTSTLAFRYFAEQEVDIAVIETGLGGRLDSTNIVNPILSIITNISLDHTALLGDTLGEIATEKAGIIKRHVPVVIGERSPETDPVFISKAREMEADIIFARQDLKCIPCDDCNLYPDTPFGEVRGELKGEYQVKNASTVFSAIEVLRTLGFGIYNWAVRDGMANVTGLTHLFGRWSCIGSNPLTIADTGHNCGGWQYLTEMIRKMPQPRKSLVIGFVSDKDLSVILDRISQISKDMDIYFSTPSVPRGLDARSLAGKAAEYGIEGHVVDDVNEALAKARAGVGPDGFVLVTGSNFLIADLLN